MLYLINKYSNIDANKTAFGVNQNVESVYESVNEDQQIPSEIKGESGMSVHTG